MNYRRIVTDIESKFESDSVLNSTISYEDGHQLTEIWTTDSSTPALTDKYSQKEFTLDLAPGCSRFIACTIPPFSKIKIHEISKNSDFNEETHGMHSTQTIDYVIILSGEIELVLKSSSKLLKKGDVVIQRGSIHSWHNNTQNNVEIIAVMIGTKPHDKFKKKFFEQAVGFKNE